MPTLGATPATPPTVSRFRWTICALLFGATTINYMDRQVLGLLAPVLQPEIGWTEVEYGHIVTAFQAAYALGLMGFGRLIDAIGTRRGYSASMISWSIATAGHALAATPFGFGAARFALGLGQGGNFPAAVKAIGEWFPRRERALANGIFNSGANIGAMLAPAIVPWLAAEYGWRTSLVVLGVFGFGWVAAWHWLYRAPEKSPHVSAVELAHIRSDPPEPPLAKIPWTHLFRYRQTWAFVAGYALTSPIWWFFLFWLPKFLNQRHGLNLSSLGLPLVAIYTITSCGSVGGGWLSSALLRRGYSVNAARKTAMLVCAGCVVPVFFAAGVSNVWVATLLIGLATAAHQGWSANLFALASDLFPKQAVASVVGLGGMVASLAAMAFSQSAGLILQHTGSYWSLFAIASAAYLFAWGVIQVLSPKLKPAEFPA